MATSAAARTHIGARLHKFELIEVHQSAAALQQHLTTTGKDVVIFGPLAYWLAGWLAEQEVNN